MSAINLNGTVTSAPESWRVMGRVPGSFDTAGVVVEFDGTPVAGGHVILFRNPQTPEFEYRILTDAEFEAEFPNQP